MIYLDNAATSFPKPPQVLQRVEQAFSLYGANPGRGAYPMSNATAQMVQRSRQKLAELLHAPETRNIVFTASATEALNIAICGFLKPGDHVVLSGLEHNAVYRPLKYLEQHRGISLTVVPPDSFGRLDVQAFSRAIRRSTALIVCLHASNVTGSIAPLEELCFLANRKGIAILIDASQSAGLLPVDIAANGIDMLAVAGHKSLLGPMGTGALYCAPHIRLEPFVMGGTGSLSEEWQQPEFLPDRFESGTVNVPGICGLCGGMEYVAAEGTGNIFARESSLMDYFIFELAKMPGVRLYGPPPGEPRVPLVTLNIEGFSPQELAAILAEKYDIAARAGYQCTPLAHFAVGDAEQGGLRFSAGAFTTVEDIEEALRALHAICRK